MTARPKTVPEWATEETYDEPLEAWHGTPTKVEPTAERRTEGWRPRDRPPATYENWRANAVGAWLAFLANVAIANWTRRAIADTSGALLANKQIRCGVHNSVELGGDGKVLVFGEKDGGGDCLAATTSDLYTWSTETIEVAASSPPDNIYAACLDLENGLVIAVGSDGSNAFVFTRPQSGSTTWTQRTQPPGVTFRAVVHGASASGTVVDVAVGFATATDDARIYTSSLGTGWGVQLTTADRPLHGVANKPGVMWVAVGDDTTGGASAGVAFSSPDGTTWTERTVACGALRRVVWCPRSGLFFAAGLGGARATSADGVTWTDRTDAAAEWKTEDVIDVATDGEGTILVLAPEPDANVTSVWCSTDGGVTWTRAFPVSTEVGVGLNPSCLFAATPRFGWLVGSDPITAGNPIVWESTRL